MWIFLFIILAIGAALNGDTSGLEGIGKIILYGGLFLGFAWAIVNAPWLIVVGVVILIIVIIAGSNSSNNNNNNTTNNTYNNTHTNAQTYNKPISNPTPFQNELNQVTKSPLQVADEKWQQEREQIIKDAKSDYEYAKSLLLKKAQSGEYINIGGQKLISVEYCNHNFSKYISRRDNSTRSAKLLSTGYNIHGRVEYTINNQRSFDLYIKTLCELSINDNISVTPIYTEEVMSKSRQVSLPYVYTGEYNLMHKVKANIRYTIKY